MELAALTAFLAPLLSHVMKLGGRVGEAVAEKVGDETVSFAQRLWDRLRGKVEEKEAAKEAAEDLARDPDDGDLRTALLVQLKKLFAEDAGLAADIGQLWNEARAAGVVQIVTNVTASGAGSVAIGRDASGTTITTGQPTQP